MKKDRRDQIIAGSALGPAGVLIAQNQQKKKINEETGEDFKTYRQLSGTRRVWIKILSLLGRHSKTRWKHYLS